MIVGVNQLRTLKAEIKSDLRAIDGLSEAIAEAVPSDPQINPPKIVRSGLALYKYPARKPVPSGVG